MSSETVGSREFEELIRYIQESRGLDFRGYKRTSLRRRIALRMEAVGAQDCGAYQSFLEAHPQEFAELLNTVLINVTSFFRDPEAWQVLRTEVVPRVIERAGKAGQIRLWSVGCASGEEAYSAAMLFAEALGMDEFTRLVKVYATDLDEGALRTARHAAYTARDVEPVSADLLEKYFERTNGGYVFQRELRKCMIFGRHNVVVDAPISRIDLLICRNLLIYLELETQNIVLPRLHYALVDDGFLLLGKAETQLVRSNLFRQVNLKQRVFAKVGQEWRRTRGGSVGRVGDALLEGAVPQVPLLEAVVDSVPTACLAVDAAGDLVFANSAARRLLDVGPADIGRPFQDLSISYRPSDLRSRIEDAQREMRPLRLDHQEYQKPPGEPMRLTVDVVPLFSIERRPFATLLTFTETTRLYVLQQELEAAQDSLETTVEELQSANEELETTNEELQSANEELETTNEELQSTNEELETMNEELRSTNDELEMRSVEQQNQTDEAGRFRRHSESVLRSIDAGIMVLDQQLVVLSMNRWNENMWGLRAEEAIGRKFLDLDLGIALHRLEAPIREIMAGPDERTDVLLDGFDRRGRRTQCRVRISRLQGENRSSGGIVLFMDDVTEERNKEEYARHIGRVIGQSLNEVYFLDPATLRFTLVNRGAEEKLGYGIDSLRQMSLADLLIGVPADALRLLIAPLIAGKRDEVVFETTIEARYREYPAEICLQYFGKEDPPILVAIVHDTTERQRLGEAAE